MHAPGMSGGAMRFPPDYCNSLDSCREFEQRISLKEQNDYAWMIRNLRAGGADDFQIITASPAHRCEAFLRMHKQWDV